MLSHQGDGIEGKTCVISGAGNVALYCAEKLLQLGGKVVALSDSGGFVHDPDGFDEEKLQWLIELKTRRRGSLSEYADRYSAQFHAGSGGLLATR